MEWSRIEVILSRPALFLRTRATGAMKKASSTPTARRMARDRVSVQRLFRSAKPARRNGAAGRPSIASIIEKYRDKTAKIIRGAVHG